MKSNSWRNAIIGFSMLIPIVVTGLIHNMVVVPTLFDEQSTTTILSFCIWAAMVLPAISAWKHLLWYVGMISETEKGSSGILRAFQKRNK